MPNFQKMNILVTGGTGLVGSHLLFSLTKAGKMIRAIKRSSSDLSLVKALFESLGATDGQWEKISWLEADILDYPELDEAFEGIQYVYHAAAMISFNPKDWQEMYKINVQGTEHVVNLALSHKVKKLIHVSSIASLGRAKETNSIDEETHWKDSKHNSGYAISKYNAELEIWRGIEEGLNAAIVNPGVILGPGFWGQGSAAIFDKAWQEFPFYTNGVNAFVDVQDVVDAMIYLMESSISSERYILSGGNYSFKAVLWGMADRMKKKRAGMEAGPVLRVLASYIDWLKAFLRIAPRSLTRETARNAGMKNDYSNAKAQKELGMKFRSLDTMLDAYVPKYLEYKAKI
jgi:nucleoside-diphosphate-sugar epimerase